MTTRHQILLTSALDCAAQGLYIVPLHEPLFDAAGKVSGCTCEAYKRSAKYQAWLAERGQGNRFDPAYKCRTPGKHPRLADWESAASIDPEQVRTWWQCGSRRCCWCICRAWRKGGRIDGRYQWQKDLKGRRERRDYRNKQGE